MRGAYPSFGRATQAAEAAMPAIEAIQLLKAREAACREKQIWRSRRSQFSLAASGVWVGVMTPG